MRALLVVFTLVFFAPFILQWPAPGLVILAGSGVFFLAITYLAIRQEMRGRDQ